MKLVKKISLLVFILFISCESNEFDNKTIAKAYVDIMVSREEFSNKLDTLAVVREEILQKHNLTLTEYESAIEKLKTNDKAWEDFYKEVYIYLDSLKAEVGIN